MPDTIEHRIAEPDVRRFHVNLRPQSVSVIREFPGFHPAKQIEIFVDQAVAKRTLLSNPPIFVRLLGRHVVDIRLTLMHKIDSELVELVEIIRSVERRTADIFVRPTVDQPAHVRHDGIDILGFFFCGISVVHSYVANAAELARNPEIETDRFRVADMEITVRLRRKTGMDLSVIPSPNIPATTSRMKSEGAGVSVKVVIVVRSN